MDDNSSTTTLTRQCNFDFLIMHVVPTRASSPQHIEHKYTPGHQALKILSKGSRASSPQRVEHKYTPGHQALNLLSKGSRASSPQLK
ncbi:hypothetical protein MTR_6g047530 [Medicago truncatula]|uniref:Uncharacterized protein n=1 Tax=Medicago truncatula TaxID=3880 RepID=A0A072U9U6_MEDTR|nr:hypothetical protein MTR_6g047530 [Medicago truncatula]